MLIALKSGRQFTLVHFDRYGVGLGAFGSAALQSQLTKVSTRATYLSRLKRYGRIVAILGALGLLLLALRIRKRQEQSATADVVHLKGPAPKRRTLAIVAALVGLVIVIFLVLFVWLGLSLTIAHIAKQTHSPILMRVAFWIIPVLLGLTAFATGAFWRSTKLFLTLQMRRAQQRMQTWAPYLPAMLHAGEDVEDFGLASGWFRVKLLLATNHRLLVLGAPGDTRKPLWQASWTAIRRAHATNTPWWLRCVSPNTRVATIECRGLQPPLNIYAINRWHVEQLESMIGAAKARFVAHPPAPLAKGATALAATESPAARSPWRSALLSLILPGLGQLDQGRLRHGLNLMWLALAVLGVAAVSWIVALGHFADQPKFLPGILAAVYALVCIVGIWDAVRYAREAA